MTLRLVKIAKELNVGTSTIVEYLNTHGFDLEDKPSAKVTDEMHHILLKEFSKDRDIKEQADQLIIGNRPGAKKETVPPPPPKVEKPAAPVIEDKAAPKTESAPTPPKEETPREERTSILKPRLTVVGKIDLAKKGAAQQPPAQSTPPPPVEKAPPAEKVEDKKEVKAPKVEASEAAPPVVEKPAVPKPPVKEAPIVEAKKETPPPPPAKQEQPVEQKKPASTAPPKPDVVTPSPAEESQKKGSDEGIYRAESPELRGLKILGKIDTDKFKKPKKKKEKEKEKPKTEPVVENKAAKDKPAPSEGDDAARKKRRRKRKKVTPTEGQTGGGSGTPKETRRPEAPGKGRSDDRGRGNVRDDSKEVSKKEVEDQIRATMARLSGGGKKKRQKIRRDNRERHRERQELIEQEGETGKLEVTEFVSVSELASLMDVAVTEVITACLNLGVIVSINQRLDAEIIELIAEEFGHEVEFISVEEQIEEEDEIIDDPEDLAPRAPIVTVMGHVDHGKTSLLDYIRKAKVVESEAGGITQHIGAYEVVVNEKKITFLDTPGHEAFTAMRARGAKITDIAIIVIAADDSIMPQTREAISHAQAANVPIVFAINKIDKDGAAPERIKQELASMNFLVEEWGGKYQSQDISAKTGLNIDLLLEKVLLEAELLELQANPDRVATGTVLEASLDKGRGYVAKILVQNGKLDIGDPIVAGEYSGKVKAMFNERGKRVKSVGPSTPVLVLGLNGAPQAGERMKEVENDQEARQIASKRAQIAREQANRATKRISLDEIGRRLALGNFKELNLIVKADVDGSVEALSDSLIKLSIETVQVNVIHRAVGAITESDVLLASASDAIIVGFQVRPSSNARKLAEKEGVQIKLYSIIYEAIGEIKSAIEGMLEPTKEERIIAQVEVREVFKISKVGTIAGCYVQEGKITRNTSVRIIRDGIVVYPTREGAAAKIASLKRFKDDVKEVKNGMECGISIENYNDIREGDIIEGFEIVEIKQKLA
ncbi:MAG TPA: translation initiation factor IF-2 [Saprospiraceae bacterium]|nr:translation initiation factor IF-2 [Saprospiraceae bacterium]HMP22750.1 translation initiation factor IF-2 [Saprospiraceae bacterium]